MDDIDKREKRAEYRNSRQTAGGKGDANNKTSQREFSEASIWCDCGHMRDKCRCFPDREGTVTIENGKITGVEYD